ncbi:hypothetical protein RRG40_04520 [Mycoplasmopsis felis]|uniref:hypothetical protein n=1 Tax=Mycoplasmopsis felis TaxID=33923 RepID=UPI002AFDF014|nr:hypothetical protein [Mycoplasmopsis felis]WQQ05418.1 hypothetical protein RRG59_03660 [Mycoplasmopsis felis]
MKNNLEKKVSLNDLKKIEKLELKYLNKYYHFLKFAEDEMFEGFKTKEDIKDDWLGLYGTNEGKGISDFSVGAERIIYSLLNGKGIGQPNSSPVGSDLFFWSRRRIYSHWFKNSARGKYRWFHNKYFCGQKSK